jgi:hypothetical protein
MTRVSKQEYGKAVIDAIKLAGHGGSSGSIAAQALLSAYSGGDFQLDVAGLGCLDRENFEVVLTVIKGRYDTGIEPHVLIKKGSAIFRELWDRWKLLSVEERGKIFCPACNGLGRIYPNDDDECQACTRCSGSGRVCRCQDETRS